MKTREITTHKVNGCNEALSLFAIGELGPGGAPRHYLAMLPSHRQAFEEDKSKEGDAAVPVANCGSFRFQDGAIAEVGTNGITHELMLSVLIDRLQHFQAGKFAHQANAIALAHLEQAAAALKSRTMERVRRGVEGTMNV